MRPGAALLLLSALANVGTARGGESAPPPVAAKAAIARVEVRGPRIRARDVLGASAEDVDLGATPPVGSSRILERAEIERAYEAAGLDAPKKIPTAVRVSRKTRRLDATEVAAAVRVALGATALPRSATLSAVRASATEVPADFERVAVDLPPVPRRPGMVTVHAPVRFLGDGDATLQRGLVTLELSLPPEAAFPDIAKGAPIALVVRRGLVEVTVGAVATADADVGSVLGVMLKPSGRVIRARAVDKDHAIAVEGS